MLSDLDIARLKIIRAVEHADAIQARIDACAARQTDMVVNQPDSEQEHVSVPELDPEIGILAGELLYQVRSTLDHLFFGLVQRNQRGVTLPDDWESRCQFPLNTTLPVGVSTTPVPCAKFNSRARDWISDQAYTFIERYQPYNSGDGPELLRLLAKFSNIDKHRYLNVAVAGVQVKEVAQIARGQATTIGARILKNGAELNPLSVPYEFRDSPMHVKRELTLKVAFDDRTLGSPDPLLPLQFESVVNELPSFMGWYMIPCFEYLYSHP